MITLRDFYTKQQYDRKRKTTYERKQHRSEMGYGVSSIKPMYDKRKPQRIRVYGQRRSKKRSDANIQKCENVQTTEMRSK
jgi:hypothetical protein